MVTASLTKYLEGLPFVEVFFTGFDAGVAWHTVSRISGSRTMLVRGGVTIAPDVAVLDYEAPLGVPFSYVTEMFAADGTSLGFAQSTSISIDVGRRCFLHQPLDPSLWVAPQVMLETAASIVRPTPGKVIYPEGASVGRRIGSRRQAVTGLPLVFETQTVADADAMQALLGSYETEQVGVICVRIPPPMRIPRTLFASVRELTEVNVDLHRGGTHVRYEMTVDETAGPYAGLVTPLLTYEDLDAAYATYEARDAAYPTYEDMDRDYSLAGYAE